MILVVGGAGYIGSHVNKKLSLTGYDTLVYDNLVYGHRDFVKWGAFVYGDLGDANKLSSLFATYKFEAVLHFAAFAYVGESVADPQKYYCNNLVNTLNLLNTMRNHGVNIIIFSSTCATYGNPLALPIKESHPQNPINPYGNSKLMVEQILRDYRKAYGLNYVTLRYFNAAGADADAEIGERHDPETHLIPLVLDVAAGRKDSVNVFGTDYDTPDGTCIRDYIHVSDLANAHVLALEYLLSGGDSSEFNLGNGSGFSVREVLSKSEKVTGKPIKVLELERRPGDPAILIGCAEKARAILGWNPVYGDLESIVDSAWKWHIK